MQSHERTEKSDGSNIRLWGRKQRVGGVLSFRLCGIGRLAWLGGPRSSLRAGSGGGCLSIVRGFIALIGCADIRETD